MPRGGQPSARAPYDTPTVGRVFVASLVCGAVAVALFWNTSYAEFVWDDRAAVPGNKNLRPEAPWSDLLKHDFWGQNITLASSHKSFRPVTVASYRLNYAVHGADPFGYHVVNVLLHAVVTALVVVFAAILTRSVTRCVVAGLLFAVHPVHVEAVACIVGRAELLGTLFYLLATLAYVVLLQLQARSVQSWYRGWLLLATTCVLLAVAIFSKENGITAVAGFLLLELLYAPTVATPPSVTASHNGVADHSATSGHASPPPEPGFWSGVAWSLQLSVDGAVRLATVFLWTAMVMAYRVSVHAGAPLYQWTVLENQMSLMPAGAPRALTVAYTHALYAQLVVWPQHLAFDWGFATIAPISGWTDVRNLATVAAYAGLAIAVVAAVRHRSVAGLWGLGAAVAAFMPASNVFLWVGTELAERLLYLPTVGVAIAAATLVPIRLPVWLAAWSWYVPGVSDADRAAMTTFEEVTPTATSGRKRHRRGVSWPWAVTVVALVALTARSRLRTFDWLKEVRVYETGIATCPNSVKALNNMAYLLLEGTPDDWRRAEPMLLRAVEVWPDHSSAYFNLGILGMRWKQPNTTMHYLWKSVGAGYTTPGNVFMHLGLQYLLFHQEQGLQSVPDWAVAASGDAAHTWIERMVVGDGWAPTPLNIARKLLEEATRRGSVHGKLYIGRGNVARELGYLDSAVTEFGKAISWSTTEGEQVLLANAWSNLGSTYEAMGKDLEALAVHAFGSSVDVGVNDASVYSNAANFFAKVGQFDRAVKLHDRAIGIHPNDGVLVNNYAYTLELAGRYSDALRLYQQAAQLLPGLALIQNNIAKMQNLLATGASSPPR